MTDPNTEAIARAIVAGRMVDQPRAAAIDVPSGCRWHPAWCYANDDRYSRDSWYANRDGLFPAGIAPGTYEMAPIRERVAELRAELSDEERREISGIARSVFKEVLAEGGES